MQIIIEDLPENEEDHIIIRCKELDEDIIKLMQAIKAKNTDIYGYKGERIFRFHPREIYYFESVDNKVFMYGREKVYESKLKLYEIEENLAMTDFLRISKSVVLNISKIVQLHPALSGRLEAVLDNSEKVIISRQYVSNLKAKLGL